MVNSKIKIIKESNEIEVEASTPRDAIKIALDVLKAKKSELDITILREENKGLFSMRGSQLAKINAKKKLQ